MIKSIYINKIKDILNHQATNKDWQAFLFGSVLTKERFGDLDLGMMGQISSSEISSLKEVFDNSTLPYAVDVINFNEVSEDFKNNVFKNQILWIKR